MSSPTCLLVADLVHPSVHGVTPDSSPGILGHYLTLERYESEEFMENEHLPFMDIVRTGTRDERRTSPHPYIRAYGNVVARPDYCTNRQNPVSPGVRMWLLKTHWLRLCKEVQAASR